MLDDNDPTTDDGTEASGPGSSGTGDETRPVSLVEEAMRASGEESGQESGGRPDEQPAEEGAAAVKKAPAKRTPAKRAPRKTAAAKAAQAAAEAGAAEGAADPEDGAEAAPAKKAPAKKAAARKTTTKTTTRTRATSRRATKTAAPTDAAPSADEPLETAESADRAEGADAAPARSTAVLFQAPERRQPAAIEVEDEADEEVVEGAAADAVEDVATAEGLEPTEKPEKSAKSEKSGKKSGGKAKKSGKKKAKDADEDVDAIDGPDDAGTVESAGAAAAGSDAEDAADADQEPAEESAAQPSEGSSEDSSDETGEDGGSRRRGRRRGGRRRRRGGSGESGDADQSEQGASGAAEGEQAGDGSDRSDGSQTADGSEDGGESDGTDGQGEGTSSGSRRRRRRRRSGSGGGTGGGTGEARDTEDDRSPEDQITSLSGSTRLEAKKQRRREGREAGRRRAPIVSEAEFLARRESVERVMAIRQREDLTQIAVLEDKVLVEHYVARESQTSLIGNVYLGRVQNVLPSMEAAFIDIGKGRNAVLYAGEVNWKALGAVDGQPRKIESVLKSGQTVLVQVTKDPIGHKGARLTSQISLPGRFLVYVPDGTTSGISRKLPEGERNRLKTLLKQIVPASAGVIVRTAAEGASEEELTHDVERLTARWSDIEAKVASGRSPALLYGEPDLTLKVVRDLFTEDFARLVVQGDDAWDLVDGYVGHVAPDLRERLERFPAEGGSGDLFASYRIDEQIAKGLDRKVWLPSGGSLIIDRTEAMTVVDVNTGKFTGSGGNLEETVTKNNLEAAEEIVRQLRLRDIGGIIVVDFIDMVLESNRDLVLRRMVECLGRDRTRHQVAEVTSLGLVQMTRKRIGTGLLEAFSDECGHCKGRGLTVHDHPIEPSSRRHEDDEPRRGGRRGRGRNGPAGNGGSGNGGNGGQHGNGGNGNGGHGGAAPAHHHRPTPAEFAAMARSEGAEKASTAEPGEGAQTADTGDTGDTGETVVTQEALDVEPVEVQVAAEPVEPVAPDEPVESGPDPVDADTAAAPVEPAVDHDPPVAPVAPPAPAAPAVVTSTRRRTARRAAGPPAPVETPDSGEAPVSLDPTPADAPVTEEETEPLLEELQPDGTQPDQDEHDASVLHVPVKRKGVRKR